MAQISGFKFDVIQVHKGDQPWTAPILFPPLNTKFHFQGLLHTCGQRGHLCPDRPELAASHRLGRRAAQWLLTLGRWGPRNRSAQEAGVGTVLTSRYSEQAWLGWAWLPGSLALRGRAPPVCWVPYHTYCWTPTGFAFWIFSNTIWQVVEQFWWRVTVKISLPS